MCDSSSRLKLLLLLALMFIASGCREYVLTSKNELKELRQQIELQQQKLSALNTKASQRNQNNRYKLFFDRDVGTLLLDAQTGRSWRKRQDIALEGKPILWEEMSREDNSLAIYDLDISFFERHPLLEEGSEPTLEKDK